MKDPLIDDTVLDEELDPTSLTRMSSVLPLVVELLSVMEQAWLESELQLPFVDSVAPNPV
jgi:hypothetical protein